MLTFLGMRTSCSCYYLLLVSLKSITSADCTFYSSLDVSRVFCNQAFLEPSIGNATLPFTVTAGIFAV
jgi:hypothetical protein